MHERIYVDILNTILHRWVISLILNTITEGLRRCPTLEHPDSNTDEDELVVAKKEGVKKKHIILHRARKRLFNDWADLINSYISHAVNELVR